MKLLRMLGVLVYVLGTWSVLFAADESTFFREQVEPVLRTRCFECHSHSSGQMEGGLALDWRSGWEVGGNRGPAIVPRDPEHSRLIQAVRHLAPGLQMPEVKLPEQEISILVRWVEEGAFDDRTVQPDGAKSRPTSDWWSLKPLEKPKVPGDGNTNPIDAFIRERLVAEGIDYSSEADRTTLIRRVYHDLIGLPPTPMEVGDFVADSDESAYESLVARLLASPRYGERWARHWLDTIHFADSHGFEHDIGRDHAWPYRDYVIESLNRDTSWPRFIREQIAADFFYPDEPRLTPALGFLGAGTFDLSTFSTAPVTFDYLDRDDLVTQTMAAFVSTTANCARCHAHKFDPISQEDYYALQAVFAGVLKGDISYDNDLSVMRERRRWKSLVHAIEQRDAELLLAAENIPRVNNWLSERGDGAIWQLVDLKKLESAEGATLTQSMSGDILASGPLAERDVYTLVATTKLDRITALRLSVLPDDTLPLRGPGRNSNGNLHLSEIELRVIEPVKLESRQIKFRYATADFNQADWGIHRAIDGDLATAWGIFPAVGQPHHAVFELSETLTIKPGDQLTITLRQAHGGSHLIGAFRVDVTESSASKAVALPSDVKQAIGIPIQQRTVEQQIALSAFVLGMFADESLKKLPPPSIIYAAAASVNIPGGEGQMLKRELPEPKVVNLLHRGDFDKPKAIVQPGALEALSHLPPRFNLKSPKQEVEARAALADWLAHSNNVLTWRSIVNRVWHYHFGRGLCDTPSDFGRMGGTPSHPELLDWLAVWFRDDADGSLKELHRLIVSSATYRQSSKYRDDIARLDGENRLIWRQNRQRLDADSYRDFTLAVSGNLDLKMGGPAIQHFKKRKGPQATPALDYMGYNWSQPEANRRSIYRFVWRGIADPFMEVLDFPDLGQLSPVRGFSTSSLQALSLYNNDFVLHNSVTLAKRMECESKALDMQIRRVIELVWLRIPSPEELRMCTEFVQSHGLAGLCRVLLNSNEFLFVD